jgi:epothilone polyketide synthase A
VERLALDGHSIFVELSPHPVLLPAVHESLRQLGRDGLVLPSLRREADEPETLLAGLGTLFTIGRPVRWEAVGPAGRVVRLPSYPWRRQRFWLETSHRPSAGRPREADAAASRPAATPEEAAAPAEELVPASGQPFRIELTQPGAIDNVVLRMALPPAPGPGEVQVAVEAAALSYPDVLRATGQWPALPDGSRPIAIECAGTVAAVGAGVEGLKVGDPVIAIAPQGLATRAVVPASLVAVRRPDLRAEDAATLPLAYLAAYHALLELSRLAPGERVLVHSAASGVGLAAVHVARRVGADVVATAGTAQKQEYLRSLGVRQVVDSRSASLAAEVAGATGGEGVDVVLSSLPPDAPARSAGLLRSGGRFVQLTPGPAPALSPNRSSFSVDLLLLARERPARFAALFGDAMRYVLDHGLGPLPRRVFPVSETQDALRHLARGRHIGRVVLSMDDDEVRIAPAAGRPAAGGAAAPAPPWSPGASAAAVLAAPAAERQRLLEDHLRHRVAGVLRMPAGQLDVNRPLSTLGIDSLMAVELKNRVEGELQVSVPLVKVVQGPSVADLAALLVALMGGADLAAPDAGERRPDGKSGPLLLSLLSLAEAKRDA